MNEQERSELVAYLDGELDADTARAVEARLSRDPRARAEAEALTRTWDLLDYLPTPEPSTEFTHRTLERLSGSMQTIHSPSGRAWSSWAIAAGWAASVLLALGVGWGIARSWSGANNARAQTELEGELERHLRVIENQRLFRNVDDLAFARALDHPDLFGDDSQE
jgi:anti-sigma factor RsiW